MIDLPLVSLDLEILDSDTGSEIIEVGAVKFRGAETLDTFSALVRPKGTLSFRVGNLTGLTARDLARGEPLRDVLDRLSTFVGGATIVGQSIGLDLEHLKKAGLDLANRRFDTFELAVLLRPGLKAYDLGSIARELGVGGEIPHRALADAELARAVFVALVEEAVELPLETLAQVVRLAAPLDWPLEADLRAGVPAPPCRRCCGADASRAIEARSRAARRTDAARRPAESLEPDARFAELDPKALGASIAPGGQVARSLPGYEDRPAQRRMLAAVARRSTTATRCWSRPAPAPASRWRTCCRRCGSRSRTACGSSSRPTRSTSRTSSWTRTSRTCCARPGLPARVSVLKGRPTTSACGAG